MKTQLTEGKLNACLLKQAGKLYVRTYPPLILCKKRTKSKQGGFNSPLLFRFVSLRF